MSRQQERARRTRAAIVESAAIEFARRGYGAASVNAILEHSGATKGAMYFHFDSKEELARAVLAEGLERYRVITERWLNAPGLDPFERLHGLVGDLADALQSDVIIRAEFKLVTEPEFDAEAKRRGSSVWGAAGRRLAVEARDAGLFRAGVDLERFLGVLGACLAGQRYFHDLTAEDVDVRARFAECLDVCLEATAAPEWLERRRGGPESRVGGEQSA